MTRTASSRPEAALAQLDALWTDLMARLSLAAEVSTQTQTRLQLRALGVHRTRTVASNLARELLVAQRMAAVAGVQVRPLALQRRIGEMSRPGTLLEHLRELAEAYRQLRLDPGLPSDATLHKWLAARLRVHSMQVESFDQVSGRRTPGP